MKVYSAVFLAAALVLACERAAPPAPAATTSAPPAPHLAVSPSEGLDRLDTRAGVPLLPMMANHQKQNMRDHLLVVQEIVAALAAEDFPAVEQASARMGYSDQMGQMCSHMGAGAPQFTEQALHFHRTADTIAAAARQHDRRAVLEALGETLQTCTSCHSTWKQQLVDEQTWEQATSSAAPHGHAAP